MLQLARTLLAVSLAASGMLAAGCTKAEDAPQPETPRVAQESTVPPVDVSEAERDSAERAVLGFVRYIQVDALPLALEAYHDRVLKELGRADVIQALASQQDALALSTLDRIESEANAGRRLVTVRLRLPDRKSQGYSFVMRRRGRDWLITYDSLLANALQYMVQQEVQSRAGDKEPAADAIRAGQRAAARYAGLFAGGPRD